MNNPLHTHYNTIHRAVWVISCFFGMLPMAAMADSERIYNEANGHYYQRFDTLERDWRDAKAECENKGAHLVTVSNKAEQDYLDVFGDTFDSFWLGGTNESGKWKWVTGEPFSYTFWLSGEPNNNPGYLLRGNWVNARYGWYDDTPGDAYGYICEWEPLRQIDLIQLPDLNGNGSVELAALFVETKTGQHLVAVKDIDSGIY